MNFFDLGIIRFVNNFAQRSWWFDHLMVLIANNTLLKGGVMIAMFWWGWNEFREKDSEQREYLLFGLIASVSAVFLARALALSLPFRLRPFHNPALGFRLPLGMEPDALIGWSAFPSDHAALFFCVAACIWFISRRLGIFALCYAFFVISLPRVYLGIHHPTDVIAGAVMGIAVACVSRIVWLRKGITRPVLKWSEVNPALFNAALFLATYEIAELFESVRRVGRSAFHVAHLLALLPRF